MLFVGVLRVSVFVKTVCVAMDTAGEGHSLEVCSMFKTDQGKIIVS